jgi:hypothetical protein
LSVIGTDLTEWQLKAAENFLRAASEEPLNSKGKIVLAFGDLVRIVAWYGQIRAKGVESGIPADEPGETFFL